MLETKESRMGDSSDSDDAEDRSDNRKAEMMRRESWMLSHDHDDAPDPRRYPSYSLA